MKNLIFSFILLTTNLFSQTNLNIDFCDFLYKKNSINHKIDFDTTNVKILIDTLKNYIIEKGDYYHKLMARLEKENSKLYHSRVTNHGKEYNESVFKKYSEGVNRAMDHKVSIKFYQ